VLKRVEVCCSNSYHTLRSVSSEVSYIVLGVAVCCSVLWCVAVCSHYQRNNLYMI